MLDTVRHKVHLRRMWAQRYLGQAREDPKCLKPRTQRPGCDQGRIAEGGASLAQLAHPKQAVRRRHRRDGKGNCDK